MRNEPARLNIEAIAGRIVAIAPAILSVSPRTSPHGDLTEFDVELSAKTGDAAIVAIEQAIRQALVEMAPPEHQLRARLRIEGRLCRVVESD